MEKFHFYFLAVHCGVAATKPPPHSTDQLSLGSKNSFSFFLLSFSKLSLLLVTLISHVEFVQVLICRLLWLTVSRTSCLWKFFSLRLSKRVIFLSHAQNLDMIFRSLRVSWSNTNQKVKVVLDPCAHQKCFLSYLYSTAVSPGRDFLSIIMNKNIIF